MNVLGVRDSKWEKDGQTVVTYWVRLEGHEKEVPSYDARAQDLKVGEALPDGWTIAQSKAGRDYLKPPAKQGSGSKRDYVPRFTDTEAGWRTNDERVDRRAALAAAQAEGSGITTELAEKFYSWLRKTVPASGIEGYGGISHPTARGKDSSGSPPEARSGLSVSGVARGESDSMSAPRKSDDAPTGDRASQADTSLHAEGGGGERTVRPTHVGVETSSTDAQPDEALASDSTSVGGSEDRGGQEDNADVSGKGAAVLTGPPCPKCKFTSRPSPNMRGWRVCMSSTCGNAWKSGEPVAV